MTTPTDTARLALDDMAAGLDRLRTALADAYGRAGHSLIAAGQSVATAERRADTAETELRILRAGIRSLGGDPTTIQNLWAQLRMHNRQWRDAKQDAERFKADYLAACKTIADMHEAATGRTGMGPVRGVVEDVADMRHRADEAEKRAHDTEQALHALRGVTDTARAEKAEAERDELHAALGLARGQLNSAALSAIHGRGANIRELTTRAEQAEAARDHEAAAREQAQQDAKDAKERARVVMVAAHSLRLQTPDRAQHTLGRIRAAHDMCAVWIELGLYYGMKPEEASMEARARRTATERIAERHAQRAEADVKEVAERLAAAEERAETASVLGARYMGDAERYQAAWQSARRRAALATIHTTAEQ